MIIGVEWGRLAGALALALAFGVLYAFFTHWMRREGHLRGHTSYQVMWGVMVTLTINDLEPSPALLVAMLEAQGR